jgi:hypothetical protein
LEHLQKRKVPDYRDRNRYRPMSASSASAAPPSAAAIEFNLDIAAPTIRGAAGGNGSGIA